MNSLHELSELEETTEGGARTAPELKSIGASKVAEEMGGFEDVGMGTNAEGMIAETEDDAGAWACAGAGAGTGARAETGARAGAGAGTCAGASGTRENDELVEGAEETVLV